MGVDYYTCQFCDECFTTSGDYGTCRGCDAMWCANCAEETHTWKYGGEHYCELCFTTDKKDISASDMRDYLLTKCNLKYDQVYEEMRLLPEFSTPQNTYECKTKQEHDCCKTCLVLGDDFGHGSRRKRGLCCVVRYEEDRNLYCSECSKEKKIKSSK